MNSCYIFLKDGTKYEFPKEKLAASVDYCLKNDITTIYMPEAVLEVFSPDEDKTIRGTF